MKKSKTITIEEHRKDELLKLKKRLRKLEKIGKELDDSNTLVHAPKPNKSVPNASFNISRGFQ